MKQKLLIGLSVLLLLVVIFFMARDMFLGPVVDKENPTEYDLASLKEVDSSQICYRETRYISPSIGTVNALVVDSASNIYLTGDNEIQVYSSSLKKTQVIKIDTSANCIALSKQQLFIGAGNHVEVYSAKGQKLNRWKSYNAKSYITSIAIKANDVYVADAANRLLLKYDRAGNFIQAIGKKDKEKGYIGFVIPSMYFDVAVSADEELWVVNPGKHELENFTDKGDFRTSWGITSMRAEGFAGCCNPTHFCMLTDGSFVTYEKGLDRVKLHNPTGEYVCMVASLSDKNHAAMNNCGIGAQVHDLAADSKGAVYVLDASMKRIRIFEKK